MPAPASILGAVQSRASRTAAIVLALTCAASCRSASEGRAPLVQPGAPGQDSRAISAGQAADLSKVRFTDADVRFMQGMIGHHAQALEMTALVPSRTAGEDMKKLALRIEVSQADEIAMMKRWLEDRRQAVPDRHAHHAHGARLMPGMLTADEMTRLAAASGIDFDRLFLVGMIKHHEGALTMVQELYGSGGGAGQESEIYAFASDVDADQRMEIDRMRAMLDRSKELQK
jgi:uncharacterized protein (DUF305 family)